MKQAQIFAQLSTAYDMNSKYDVIDYGNTIFTRTWFPHHLTTCVYIKKTRHSSCSLQHLLMSDRFCNHQVQSYLDPLFGGKWESSLIAFLSLGYCILTSSPPDKPRSLPPHSCAHSSPWLQFVLAPSFHTQSTVPNFVASKVSDQR